MASQYRALIALTLVISACAQPLRLTRDDSPFVLNRQLLQAPNPGLPGTYRVRTMYYGSGTDLRRPEFRDSVTLKTASVDGSKLASASGDMAKSRKKYWGFGLEKMPVNGRVWYPEGDGPFPLVLVVHGNHDMKDFSDPGYRYLGELFASRGFILTSVDENFLNGSLGRENDARGWMLLKHLEAWKRFNDSTGSPFHRKVDFDNLALVGHSRGGEAVAIAGLFNRLTHYPDDANLRFNFNFSGLKALIAIAPVDGQYEPASRPTPIQNYNYLVIHGSHDGDVSAFQGLRQYERLRFTDGKPWFKSAVWMYRANHGQWNSVWGPRDWGKRSERGLDLRGLVHPESQRQMARVFFGGFLEATLKGKREYLPMFRDHRLVGEWLPKTMYVTRFQESGFRPLADFADETDVDVTAGTSGVTFEGDSLATWREGLLPLRWRSATIGHGGLWLGWNNRIAGDDTTKRGRPAAFNIKLSDSLRSSWQIGRGSTIVLSLAPEDSKPGPRAAARDTTKAAGDSAKKGAPKPKPKPAPKKPPKDTIPIDLSVEVTDANGVSARVPLSRYGAIRRPLDINVYRRKGRDKQRFATEYELVLQTFVLPLGDFVAQESRFDPSRLVAIRLVFDRTEAGSVVVSDIGISNPIPEFLAVRP